ncbi:TIGR00730 family Rossman fold protein [Bordetella sp. 15P40C-2]|uniref:LOG family protein n=1 Tax=Bordetella sp. 15P40C-2 TaxID=2572246 RepID=UPI001322C815|nr:TIGR00730 family Rossman fold protein [Bordetella sp. 15P40C-2]MVW71431.1 TIGR00730 family Rossman fold protein [Bordetella sp. 15P40C-2]
MTIKNLCVYCGSNAGNRPDYIEAARALAREMVRRDIGLVYGGASVGIMGAVADAVLAEGGRAVGIIPESLMRKEIGHRELTELHIVGSMHERKTMMAERSDGFIALPGGAGTLEELFETWTWAQLGMHQKPCGMLNIAGYYDQLAGFLDHAVQESFIRAEHRAMLIVEQQPSALLDRYAAYTPPTVSKWIDQGEH